MVSFRESLASFNAIALLSSVLFAFCFLLYVVAGRFTSLGQMTNQTAHMLCAEVPFGAFFDFQCLLYQKMCCILCLCGDIWLRTDAHRSKWMQT